MGVRDWFRSPQAGVGITAAATVLTQDSTSDTTRLRRGPEPWQIDAWNAYYELGEISYPMNYQSNALSRLRLVPAMQLDPREPPIVLHEDGDDDIGSDLSPDERAAMIATIDRLGMGHAAPISEIQRLLALNLALTGDCYLAGWNDDDGENWDILSVEELTMDPNGRGFGRRTSGYENISGVESFPEDAFICRLYQRDARFKGRAYSTMRSVLPLTNELRILTDSIAAVANSRIPAGILVLPLSALAGPTNERLTGQTDGPANDPVLMSIQEHFETPIMNRKSASAVTPYLLAIEGADVDKVNLIEPNREIDRLYIDLRAEVIRRIGVGVDLPPEVLTGLGDVKFWNAQMIDESTFKYHLEPDAMAMAWALTYGYYRPHLAKMGIENVQRCVLWYDATPLVSHPNQTTDYSEGHERLIVSDEAWRRVHGVPEEDAPDDEERARRLWVKTLEKAPVQPIAFPSTDDLEAETVESAPDAPVETLDKNVDVEVEPAVRTGPPETPPRPGPPLAVPPIAALTASATIAPLGPRLANIEKALRLRLLQAADDAMARALEKAGGRLRNLASKQSEWRQKLSGVDALDVAGRLGPATVAGLAVTEEDLLAGAFAGLAGNFTTWTRRAQEQALAAIDDHGELTEADAVRIKAEMDNQRDEGQAVLLAGLLALAGRLLYQPHTEPPTRGEWSDFRVDPAIISNALREAGGGTSDRLGTSGLLSGSIIGEALDAASLTVTTYTWIHGDPVQDFPAHRDLDGQDFTGWDDPVLANDGDWPDVEFFSPTNGPAGADHDSCTCFAELRIERELRESEAEADAQIEGEA